MVHAQLTFNKAHFGFIPFWITYNYMDGGWLKVYLYTHQQPVLFMKYVLLGNVGSIVLSTVILFAKCHIINDIIISAQITYE